MDFVMILQLLIVLGALYVGSRYGSLALGAISDIGLVSTIVGLIITIDHYNYILLIIYAKVFIYCFCGNTCHHAYVGRK